MSRPAKSKVVTLSPSGDVLSSVVVRDPQAPGGGWQVKLGDDIVASGAGAMPRDWFERVADRFPAVEPAAPQLEPWERVASRVDLELGTLRARIDDMQHTIDAELLKAMERTINALPAGR